MLDGCVPVLEILKNCCNYSDNAALIDDRNELKYSDLGGCVNSLSLFLNKRVSGKGKRIAIISDYNNELIIAILATMASGDVFVPIDSTLPMARVSEIVTAASPCLILCDKGNYIKAKEIADKHAIEISDIDILKGDKNLVFNISGERIDSCESQKYNSPELHVDDPCVIYFTSGSTGKPKGVELSHGGYSYWYKNVSSLTRVDENDRVALSANYCFDISLGEILLALLSGSSLYICDQRIKKSPYDLVRWLEDYKITIFQIVPSLMKALMCNETRNFSLQSLRVLISTGENLEFRLVSEVISHFRNTNFRILNLYGPVEASIHVSYCWADRYIDRKVASIPIGKAFNDTNLKIVKKNEDDESGELYIAGPQLALGYLNSEITEKSFNRERTPDGNSIRYYKTGDIVSLNSYGDIIYKGRLDSQVKIRGIRIEIGDVENSLKSISGVTDSIVLPCSEDNETILVAFAVCDKVLQKKLRRSLAGVIPIYMLPKHILFLDGLPINPNGKRDRALLKKMYEEHRNKEIVSAI